MMVTALYVVGGYLAWWAPSRTVFAYLNGRRWVARAKGYASYEAEKAWLDETKYAIASEKHRDGVKENFIARREQLELQRELLNGPDHGVAMLWPIYGDVVIIFGSLVYVFGRIAQAGVQAERRALVPSGEREAGTGQLSHNETDAKQLEAAVAEAHALPQSAWSERKN